MRRFLILLLTLVSVLIGTAQNVKSENVFHTYIYNDEYKVYMDVNLYDANISVLVRMCSGWFRDSSGRCATRVSGLLPTPRLLARTRQNWILSTITGRKTLQPRSPTILRTTLSAEADRRKSP